MSTLTIEIPFLPPRALSPNARGGSYWPSYKAGTDFADSVIARAREVAPSEPWDKVAVQYKVFWCGTAPDPDNFINSMKAALDSLVFVGIMPDDGPEHVTILPVTYERVAHRPQAKVEITVTED
jgi:Holliday junction resolvase RusA-like endonuclease|tara:strand:+ start:1832 stop:2203 length:372 start_codon:yes stop_codon:yes gene_type:complete